MRTALFRLVAAGSLLVTPVAAAPAKSSHGSICIAPVTREMMKSDPDDPRGQRPPYFFTFSVQIDQARPIPVPREKGLLVTGLEVEKRHLVRVMDGHKRIESFYFTFRSRGSNHLCLSYGPWYETWDLSPPGRRPWCKCK